MLPAAGTKASKVKFKPVKSLLPAGRGPVGATSVRPLKVVVTMAGLVNGGVAP